MRRPRFDEWYCERLFSSIIGGTRQNSRFGGFSAISVLIVDPRLADDDAIVGDGFQVRQGGRAFWRVVASNLETSGTFIRRFERPLASATIGATGSIRRPPRPPSFVHAQSGGPHRAQSHGGRVAPPVGAIPVWLKLSPSPNLFDVDVVYRHQWPPPRLICSPERWTS